MYQNQNKLFLNNLQNMNKINQMNVNLQNKLIKNNSSISMDSNRLFYLTIGVVIFVIIMVVLLVIVFKNRATAYSVNPLLIDKPVNIYDLKENNKFTIPTSERGLEYSYSCWFYVQDWYYRFQDFKCIYAKGVVSDKKINLEEGNYNPGVYLFPETNNLLVSIATYFNPSERVTVTNIPLQKWVHLVVCLNNRTVDIYVNGKLERSKVLAGVPKLNDSQLNVAPDGGFFGKLARLQYFSHSLKPDEVYSIYQDGPF